jgi:hypothetical protein
MHLPYYSNGLHFACRQCSACCRYEPGFVFLSFTDLERIVTFLESSYARVLQQYCRVVELGENRRISLIEKPNYDCIFWADGGCRIYAARPLQCRSFPFWHEFVHEKQRWQQLARSCPGIGKGPVHSAEEIRAWLRAREEETFLRAEDWERLKEEGGYEDAFLGGARINPDPADT